MTVVDTTFKRILAQRYNSFISVVLATIIRKLIILEL